MRLFKIAVIAGASGPLNMIDAPDGRTGAFAQVM
jgi:hypothetical protein